MSVAKQLLDILHRRDTSRPSGFEWQEDVRRAKEEAAAAEVRRLAMEKKDRRVVKERQVIADNQRRVRRNLYETDGKMAKRNWCVGQRASDKPFWTQSPAIAPSNKDRKKSVLVAPTVESCGGPSVSQEQYKENRRHAHENQDWVKKERSEGKKYDETTFYPNRGTSKSAPIAQVSESSVPITPRGLIF